jgi:hypothetical protein
MPSINCTSAQQIVNSSGSAPFRIACLFDELAALGLGRHQQNWEAIIPGTVPGRFNWRVSTESLGKFYLGEVGMIKELSPLPPNQVEEENDPDLEDVDSDVEEQDDDDDEGCDLVFDSEDEEEGAEDDTEWCPHVFPLRKDKDIKLELPSDFTIGEAERFALFLKSLPLAGEFPEEWSEEEEIPENTFRYLLRHGLWIETDFPADFTDDEARRLGLFLISLPIPEN